MKKKRHRWRKEVNHSYCHKYICKNCPCIKDSKDMTSTIYWIGNEKYFSAPNCENNKITSMEELEKPLGYNIDKMAI